MFSITAYVPIQNLYQLGSPFCWDSESMGWYGASLSLVMGLIGPLLIALLQRCLPDEIVLQFGYLSPIVCFAICGIASHTWMLYTGDVFFSLSQCMKYISCISILECTFLFPELYIRILF
jgi:hypothetical protein